MQAMLTDQHAEYDRNKTRGIPRPGKGKRSQGVERGTMFNRARRDQVDVRRTNW
jgi:hypothetical protein